MVQNAFKPEVTLQVERPYPVSHKVEQVESRIPLTISVARREVKSESDLSHICFMVPRLRITDVLSEEAGVGASNLKSGDIILAAGDVENPTYAELRDITTRYEKKELALKVLRDVNGVEDVVAVTVVPKRLRKEGRVMIGIALALDAEHPVVAKTVGDSAPAIPRGAAVTAVNGVKVSNFYDIIRQVRSNRGSQVTIEYRLNDQTAGGVAVDAGAAEKLITIESNFAKPIPFEELKRLYKATGPVEAIEMGCNKTVIFIAQTYITLKRLVGGSVSPKELMGPVGIVTLSYRIVAEQPLIYYVYLLGLISACIAVFNFLPLPPLDGGHIVLLTIEKIKGSALNERTIGIIAYAGWALIGTFFLYVTFNDVVRSFFQ
jgi:regulator of sigma E protease